ncbi:MAG: HAMP domain-containing sensor histidine kinase [Clostridium sp.]|nr:HAMP domain-containing sensor histidine kinase [Clostridium sp.]
MIKIKKPSNNLVLGIIVAYILSLAIIGEGSWIIYLFVADKVAINEGLIRIVSIIVAILVFIFVITKFKKLKSDKLNLYFISSIIVSLFITIQIFTIGVYLISIFVRQFDIARLTRFWETSLGTFILGNFIVLSLIGLIGVFLISFIFFINRKVKYVKYITREVKKIEAEGFGKTIDVKGNDELSELSQSINRMSSKLKEQIEKERLIERNKNELITNVSHDLRTPLTSINGYVDLLKENEFKDKKKFDEYIAVVDRRSKGLTTLVNELFEYTTLNSSDIKLNFDYVDIVTLVSHIANEYSVIFERSGLKLERNIINKEIFMELDVDKMVRVFQNLLSNANKYSLENSTVTLSLKEEESSVIISISNSTAEITEEDVPNIFSRFYKADKSRSEQDSSGLGLSIAKRIVELHSGSISVNLSNNLITFKINVPKGSIVK